ncbi:hypothetical protein BAMA_15420 [Bacillus manliponensis]|uniref:Uncharacterized protein n=1 Tax=Bacillus manliponensis TaxID=574376 RepID=A0A073JSY4_9BACI|nr:SRPBCC family protein [Bacillus manliponensis]KEK17410.1 hypothetical protein BAMA_15420 [Bacillus manliponensis]
MSYAFEVVIDAPIDVVFDYIHNDEKIKEWNTFIVENRYLDGASKENPHVGDRYLSIQKIGKKMIEVEVELLEYDAPYVAAVGGDMKEGYSVTTYMLEEKSDGTLLTMMVEYEPRNFYYKLLYKVTSWMTRAVYMQQVERLVECVESEYNKNEVI